MSSSQDTAGASVAAAFGQLQDFLSAHELTSSISGLETALVDNDREGAAHAAAAAGLSDDLMTACLEVRGIAGRLNDLIHATAISLVLPKILIDGERVLTRPSLAAGNDPSRPFDLETTHRIAEFKVAVWRGGADSMRKRTLFHDLVHLAAADTDKARELYVVGPRPKKFLTASKTTARWALNRGSDATRELYIRQYGDLDLTVRDYTATHAAQVEIIDIATYLPVLAKGA